MSILLVPGIVASQYPSGGGGAFSPSDISNMEFWYDADAMTGFIDDDNVGGAGSEWEDLSSNGYDLTQATATNQPKYKTNIQNSKPGVLFDGSNDYLSAATSAIAQGFTFIWVWKILTLGVTQYPIQGTTGRLNFRAFSDNGLRIRMASEASTGYTLDTNAHYGVFYQNGASSEFDLDGTTNYGTYDVGSGSWDDIVFGSDSGASASNCYMFEMICYSKQLTAQEQSDIESYLSTKWGI